MFCHVLDTQESDIAVTDDDRRVIPLVAEPAGCVFVVRDGFSGRLKHRALSGPAVVDTQDVVTAPVERQTGETHGCQRGRQKSRSADIEVPCVAMAEHDGPDDRAFIREMRGPVERQCIGLNGNEFGSQEKCS